MKEIPEDRESRLNPGIEECYSIAESMIDEIHQISIFESIAPHDSERHKGSLKKKLLRQIRQARRLSW